MRLLVNIDHVATLRNARGEGYPSPVEAADVCERAGAAGIVFHLRQDRRHIRDEDVYRLKKTVRGILDFEMAASDEMIDISLDVSPHLVTLVPEGREELTTEGGLDMDKVFNDFQQRVIPQYKNADIEVSLFIDPVIKDVELAAKLGAEAIELHTGTYANAGNTPDAHDELLRLQHAAQKAYALGLKVNAGHGLNLQNLVPLVENVPHLNDISIGHALISRAIFDGLNTTVHKYLDIMQSSNSNT